MIKIEKIKIKNYRSIKELLLNLSSNTVLVGKNNSGKSNILKAVNQCFEFGNIDKEDVFCSEEDPFSYEKKVTIDLKIVPVDEDGKKENNFNDLWIYAFGDSISFDSADDTAYFAFRTEYSYDLDKEAFIGTKKVIIEWNDTKECIVKKKLARSVIEDIECISINAQRDLSIDILDKRSFWNKTAINVEIPETSKEDILKKLMILNKKIIKENDTLKFMQKTMKVTTADIDSNVELLPITNDLEALYSGINVFYSDIYKKDVSINNLGLGVRSWGVFASIKAYLLSKENKKKNKKAFFPVTLVEEPEAHVHPQAQFQLVSDLKEIIGQKIFTTHSPYVLSKVYLNDLKYIYKVNGETKINDVSITEEDINSIERFVIETKGDIFFSNLIILCEGYSDEVFLKTFVKKYFGKEYYELGIEIIAVGGQNYLPFLKILKQLEIKWFIFSDGEADPINSVNKCLKEFYNLPNKPDFKDYDNVFVLEDGNCIEKYLLKEGYIKEINKAFDIVEKEEKYIKTYMRNLHGQNKKKGIKRDYKSPGGKERAIEDCMLGDKTKYAGEIANQITSCTPKVRRFPEKILALLNKASEDLIERGIL